MTHCWGVVSEPGLKLKKVVEKSDFVVSLVWESRRRRGGRKGGARYADKCPW